MRRSRGSARAARSSWAKWFNIRTRIGSATSAGRKGFSSDSPKSSAECRSLGTTTRVSALFLAKTSCVPTLALTDGSLRQWEHRSTSRSSRGCYFSAVQRATERPCGVVGLRTVVIREDVVVTAIAKNSAATFSDISRCLHPTRRLRIEIAQRLQLSILRFREDLNPHGGCHICRAVLRLVFLSCLQRFLVVTHTTAAFGAFR